MCGICGIHRPGGATVEDHETVAAMMRRLEHRGPDGAGRWADGGAVLGHRRLAIIDLEGGHQPIFDETGDVGLVFNGEIYNFRELRAQLAAAGHRFRTRSDSEVIVHGYEEWGDDVVTRLRGMFAFAIWDARRSRLLLARDRLGIKPLYLHRGPDGRLLFASEIKALFADPQVPRELNVDRLPEYLAFRSVAGSATLFRGVEELEPGRILIAEGERVHVHEYWSPEVEPRSAADPRIELERGRELLSEAVAIRLVSDVPLGTITSGGLDSSLVSALAAEAAASSIDTFCVGFADPAYDERPFARDVAARIGSRHHEIVVTPEQLEDELDRLTWAHDEPLTHPNSIPMHLIFREAKERQAVTVLLSGEGADEVFGGYEWYRVAYRRERLRRVPGLAVVARLWPGDRGRVLRRVLDPDYLLTANRVSGPETIGALSRAGDALPEARRRLWPTASRSGVDGLFVYDQRTYLPPLLQRQDRMSMAAGLEARVPFLDHQLVEWANALPAEAKIAGGRRKRLLKAMASPWLPERIVERGKVGFGLPLRDWLRPGGLLGTRVERLREPDAFVRQVVRASALDALLDRRSEPSAAEADVLWTLIALEAWASIFLGERIEDVVLPGAHTGRDLGAPAPARAG
ncbi:MAG: asparagine synthase (glutamine-hydrolyzing) [Gemmatimonadetes bacterium]|nr:asparagine synthase (glutamine-hydrolyzing) [Gemmatimonadota bacterium]